MGITVRKNWTLAPAFVQAAEIKPNFVRDGRHMNPGNLIVEGEGLCDGGLRIVGNWGEMMSLAAILHRLRAVPSVVSVLCIVAFIGCGASPVTISDGNLRNENSALNETTYADDDDRNNDLVETSDSPPPDDPGDTVPHDLLDPQAELNSPPVADAGRHRAVEEGQPVWLDGTRSFDADGDSLSFHWEQSEGPIVDLWDGDTDSPRLAAPQVDADTRLGFRLVVSDGLEEDRDSVEVTVLNLVARPSADPVRADAGPDQQVRQGVHVLLDGANSSGTGLLKYAWVQTGGPVVTLKNADRAVASFSAPSGLGENATLTFELIVTDRELLKHTDTCQVIVIAGGDGNQPPPPPDGQNPPDITLPTSDRNLACLVNLSGHAVSYPPDRWAAVPLVTDLAVDPDSVPDAHARLQEVLALLNHHSPKGLVGTYISGGRVESAFKRYPPEAIHARHMPVNWLRPNTNRVDLSNPQAGEAFADLIVAACEPRQRPIVFLDNIIHPSAMRGWYLWEDTCRFLGRVKRGVNRNGSLLVPNIAVASWGMSDKDVELLSATVDGMTFEMPYHRLARGNRERTARQIAIYRTWLSGGKIVVFIAVDSTLKTLPEKDREVRLVAAFAMLVRNPGDPLFIAWPFYRPQPDWARWPEQLGKPIGEWRFEADHQLSRRFEKGTLWMDVLSRTVQIKP